MAPPPHLHLAVALDGAGWHPAAWREPDARASELFSAGYWVDLVQEAERGLGQHGRVLLRPSGTEPLVRVMVEAPTQEAAEAAAERIVSALHTALGGVTSP